MFTVMKYVGLVLAILFMVSMIILFFAQKTYEAFKYFRNYKKRSAFLGKTKRKRVKQPKKTSPKKKKEKAEYVVASVNGEEISAEADTDVLGSSESYAEMLADANSSTVILPEYSKK